ncbi:oocyte zinc finger protein XlCOF6.1-like [Sabethes cyaneus]|uniref:oocyte zinc finger protein XlCOF6.1-like n=1 Tax=Sabethes cyaneus TaxID=53552 RepID=UPI00237DB74E|nr:oocyte zinc finger protein XlCOF6.1-like [Sabethes cyaneus]XP_053695824.1 oocyte zinc finger protein XlCOF6.1-like [Sabethes cyaneus]
MRNEMENSTSMKSKESTAIKVEEFIITDAFGEPVEVSVYFCEAIPTTTSEDGTSVVKQASAGDKTASFRNSHALKANPPNGRGSQPEHICDICGASYKSPDGLYQHKLTHTYTSVEPNPYKCDQCSSRFVHERSLIYHKKKLCRSSSINSGMLKMQKKSLDRNKSDKALLQCDLCSKTLVSRRALTVHRLIKHTSEKNFKCDICGKDYHMMTHLRRHLKSHSTERLYKCDICGNGYIRKENLSTHMKMHTTSFECGVCGQLCKTPRTLREHNIRKHTSEKNYACHVCGQDFHLKDQLTRHLRKHNPDQPHRCPVCKKGYPFRSDLAQHVLTHIEERPFACDHCDVCFKTSGLLQTHQRLAHQMCNGQKPACDICDRKFVTNNTLKRHLRTHTTERPFECDICVTSFKTRGGLKSHKKWVHSID